MLSERERRMLAQIEAHIRREEPALAHLLVSGTRWRLLLHPEPLTARGLLLAAVTVGLGALMFTLGVTLGVTALLVSGLALAMIGPLPAWLLATSARPAPLRTRR